MRSRSADARDAASAAWRAVRIAIAAAILGTAGVSASAGEVIERVLAIVSGQLVMASDVAAARAFGFVPRELSDREALDRLIDRALILAEVDRYTPPEPAEPAIADALAAIHAAFTEPARFEAALARVGFSESSLRERVRQDLRIQAYLDQRFVVALPDDEEIEAAYRTDPTRFTGGGRILGLEAARPEIVRRLVQERQSPRVSEWVDGLRRRSRIVDLMTGRTSMPISGSR